MPTSQDNHHVTVPCWALFPKTPLLNTSVHKHFLKKKSRNPFSIILAICISAKKHQGFCSQMLSWPTDLHVFCCQHKLQFWARHRGSVCYRHKFFSLNYEFHSTAPAGRRLCYRFYFPPLQNQLFQSCPATAPKGQPCQRNAVAASVKPQPLQLPLPYPSCLL